MFEDMWTFTFTCFLCKTTNIWTTLFKDDTADSIWYVIDPLFFMIGKGSISNARYVMHENISKNAREYFLLDVFPSGRF